MFKPEVEEVLTRHLHKVAAPRQLWERIENPQARIIRPRSQTRLFVPPVVAAMVLIAAVAFQPRNAVKVVEYRLPAHNLTLRVSKTTPSAQSLNTACLLCHAGV